MKKGQASSTAILIAKSTVTTAEDRRYGRFVPRHAVMACAWFLEDHLTLGRLRLALYRQAWNRRFQRAFESLSLPGIQLHYALRKVQLEKYARQALQSDTLQVVVLGAGFDTLCLRLSSEFPAVSFLEIDHPDTQTLKKRSLSERGRIPKNLRFISNDFLETDLQEVLRHAREVERKLKTLVIAEGLLMYLSENVVRNLLRTLKETFRNGCGVMFTFMAPDEQGQIRFHNASRYVDWWLRWKGEPFTWGLDPAYLNDFLRSCGFQLLEVVDHKSLRARYLAPEGLESEPLAAGECLCAAEG